MHARRRRGRDRTRARSRQVFDACVQPSQPGATAGSNNVVVNPGTGGVSQRRARPRPNDCTRPAVCQRVERALHACAGSCRARAPAPSSTRLRRRRATRAPPHARRRSAAPARRPWRSRRGASAKPRVVALTLASARSSARSRPISTRSRARCDSSACVAPNARAMQRVARHVAGPRLAERPREREQHRPRGERDHRACVAHRVTAGVDDQRLRRQQRLDLVEPERALLAAGDQARGGRVEHRATRRRPPPRAPGCRACARCPRGPFERGPRRPASRRRRSAMPATTSSWAARDAAGNGAGSSAASARSASSTGRSAAGAGPRDAAHARR